MIQTKVKEVHCCDTCGEEEDCMPACDNCGAEYCWDHRDDLISYAYSIDFSGDGDGSYCKKCAEALTASKDQRLLAYIAIQDLLAEAAEAEKAFRERAAAAEALVASFAKGRQRHNHNHDSLYSL